MTTGGNGRIFARQKPPGDAGKFVAGEPNRQSHSKSWRIFRHIESAMRKFEQFSQSLGRGKVKA
jgi:hypothetical protein